MFVLQGLLLGLKICYMNNTFQCIVACNINVGGNEAQGSLSSILSGILWPAHCSKAQARPPRSCQHLPVFNNNDQQDAFHFLEELVSATAREGNKFGRCVNLNHVYKKRKIFSEKQKGFRDGLSYSTPQKVKNKGKYPYPASVPSH